ncbi:MAG: GtrA family protein [Clostridia bacterium]|nr:GtrA family protein [Clostridia bacterium]
MKEFLKFVKFVLFSISAGLIQFASYTLLELFTDWSYWPCYLISITLSVIWNFYFNRKFTFKAANNVPVAMIKVAAFYAVFITVTTVFGDYLVKTYEINGFLVTAINMVLNFVLEFFYQRYFVFTKPKEEK